MDNSKINMAATTERTPFHVHEEPLLWYCTPVQTTLGLLFLYNVYIQFFHLNPTTLDFLMTGQNLGIDYSRVYSWKAATGPVKTTVRGHFPTSEKSCSIPGEPVLMTATAAAGQRTGSNFLKALGETLLRQSCISHQMREAACYLSA